MDYLPCVHEVARDGYLLSFVSQSGIAAAVQGLAPRPSVWKLHRLKTNKWPHRAWWTEDTRLLKANLNTPFTGKIAQSCSTFSEPYSKRYTVYKHYSHLWFLQRRYQQMSDRISEYWIIEDVEGTGCGTISDTIQEFLNGTKTSHETPVSTTYKTHFRYALYPYKASHMSGS